MELDALKLALARLDERLDQEVALQARQIRSFTRDRLEGHLRPVARAQVWVILFGALACFLGVAAWYGNFDRTDLFISGVILHAYGIVTIATGVATIVMVGQVDYSEPVVAIQKRLARVRHTALIAGMVAGMPWFILWLPFAIAVFAVLFGVDVANSAGAGFWGLIAIVGAIALAAPSLVYRWAKGTKRDRIAKAFEDVFTGANLRRAQAHLDEIARFERDS